MRVGTLCYATDQGLGILAKSFYDHGIVTDVTVIRHAHHPTHSEWYPKMVAEVPIQRLSRSPDRDVIRGFCQAMDVMLFFETPFDWGLIDHCRQHGVKTVLMPMHECTPQALPYVPDAFLCPSKLDYKCFIEKINGEYVHCYQLPVPVEVSWRQRTRAEVFVHNAGHGGLRGRNGTRELWEALRYIKSPAKFIFRTQENLDRSCFPISPAIDIRQKIGTQAYETLWGEGDVFVFPEKFNGLSLPLQEARASGMLVMGTDRFPMNEWLPTSIEWKCKGCGVLRGTHRETLPNGLRRTEQCGRCASCGWILLEDRGNPLIPTAGVRRAKIGGPYREFDETVMDPKAIAAKIDEWYGRDISAYSLSGKAWAETMSWEKLGPEYRKVLEDLLR